MSILCFFLISRARICAKVNAYDYCARVLYVASVRVWYACVRACVCGLLTA